MQNSLPSISLVTTIVENIISLSSNRFTSKTSYQLAHLATTDSKFMSIKNSAHDTGEDSNLTDLQQVLNNIITLISLCDKNTLNNIEKYIVVLDDLASYYEEADKQYMSDTYKQNYIRARKILISNGLAPTAALLDRFAKKIYKL